MLNGQDRDRAVLLTGNSVPDLAASVAQKLGMEISPALVGRFSDDEVQVQIGPDVPLRGRNVFIIQSTYSPAENWFELWLLADAALRAAANKIIWVAPYVGYGRQDRKIEGHDPISIAMLLDLTKQAGVSQIIAIDLHSSQSQGMVRIPFGHLWGRKMVLKAALERLQLSVGNPEHMQNLAIVSPDAGSYSVAAHFAQKFGCLLISGLKVRPRPNERPRVTLLDGEKAQGRICIILDDMADTCGTDVEVAERLVEKEAADIALCVTHPVFSGEAVKILDQSPISLVCAGDTIPVCMPPKNFICVSVADELAKAIRYVMEGGIVSSLTKKFD